MFTRSAREDIWRFMYTFSRPNICRNLTASEAQEMNLQFKSDFFTCRPAEYAALPVQHTKTLKKRLIFGARIRDLLSKYGKASSIVSEFGDARSCSVRNIVH